MFTTWVLRAELRQHPEHDLCLPTAAMTSEPVGIAGQIDTPYLSPTPRVAATQHWGLVEPRRGVG